jgi:hypothetical protein
MRRFHGRSIVLGGLILALSCTSAVGQQGLTITISNDTSDNIYVTAYDQSANPPQIVLSSRPIYGSASITVNITADATGMGHLSWTATTIDRDMHKCGHNDRPNLNDGDTVHVHADGDCGG